MTREELDTVVRGVAGLRGAAHTNESGVVEARSTGFDADLASAVAAVSGSQLRDLSVALGAGPLVEWAIATQELNLYVMGRPERTQLVLLGEPNELAPSVLEKVGTLLAK